MASEDGEVFIKSLAQFIRTHEKALANALQLQQQHAKHARSQSSSTPRERVARAPQSTSMSTLAAALSLGVLGFSQNVKPAKLTLTPHHLFYLLSRFEELGVDVGSMSVRLENISSDPSPANYVSFLNQPQKSQGRSDRDSVHSVSSVRSALSNMSSFWSSFGFGSKSSSDQAKTDKAKAQLQLDLKYLYSAFTKIPCLRLSPDRRARLISGYEEFPFDSAVPLIAFKNISVLEICDLDFRSFYGWDRLADQLRSLTIKRGQLDDPLDLLVHVVLDDMDKRRRRSSKAYSPSTPIWPSSPSARHAELSRTFSAPGSPYVNESAISTSASPRSSAYLRGDTETGHARRNRHAREKSASPARGSGGRPGSSHRNLRAGEHKMHRQGSGSSHSSSHSLRSRSRSRSSSNLLAMGIVPSSKWCFLRHLSIADNGITSLTSTSISPLSNTLQSLDLSYNLFTEVPDCLAILTSLRALDLSNCLIDSLHSVTRHPLPAISVLNLRANRLTAIAGIERLLSLERVDFRENKLTDPTELARLTGIPDIRDIWVDGNPFVRLHGNYRITIFNLFRATPGHAEDIVIDSYGPGYAERRQLRERATEPASRPLVRPPSVEFEIASPVEVRKAIVEEEPPTSPPVDTAAPGLRPRPRATQSEMAVGSGRRKRTAKRRIVDLSAEDAPVLKPTRRANGAPRMIAKEAGAAPGKLRAPELLASPLTTKPIHLHGGAPLNGEARPTKSVMQQQNSSLPSEHDIDTRLAAEAIANDLQQLNLSGDAYRQKVQALKDEFGTSWLRVLNDQKHQAGSDKNLTDSLLSRTTPISADLPPIRAPSQSIVGGARTLG